MSLTDRPHVTAESIHLGRKNDPSQPWLRTAEHADQELVRVWRNAHARSFFHQSPITSIGQQQWFEGYRDRSDDFLFMVMAAEQPIGCIGIRFRNNEWDLYNVIRGVRSSRSAGFMAAGLASLIAFARRIRPVAVRADVIAGNPALTWYLRNGFVVEREDTQRHRLIHQNSVSPPSRKTA